MSDPHNPDALKEAREFYAHADDQYEGRTVTTMAVEALRHLHRMMEQVDNLSADLAALRIEHEAHKALLDYARRDRDEARKERDEARQALGECFVLSGADTNGDDWRHNWPYAVDAVRELRKDYDEECGIPASPKHAPAPVVILGDGNDLHRLAQAPRGALDREALDDMPTLDLTAWIDAPMATPPNRAQRRAKDKR